MLEANAPRPHGRAAFRCDQRCRPTCCPPARTHAPFFRSRPDALLLWSTVALIPITLAIPCLPFAGLLGFVPLPGTLVMAVCAITAGDAIVVELTKRPFFRLLT